MITTNRILAIALIAALAGGSLGAILMHSTQAASVVEPTANSDTTYPSDANRNASLTTNVGDQMNAANLGASEFRTAAEQTAYKVGFADGVRRAGNLGNGRMTASGSVDQSATSRANARQVSYNHPQPHGRSFWNKHRDKLTVAMGTGGGALIGALVGGGKGAGIGALAGAGGSALYTYKLRNRHPR